MDRFRTISFEQSCALPVQAQLEGVSGDNVCAFANRVVCHKELGSGTFSHVYLGSLAEKVNGIPERFALKVSDKCSDVKYFESEVKALTLMKESPFIVDMFSSYIDGVPQILLELGDIDLNSLVTQMIKNGIKLTDGHLNFIIDNLSRAAEFMLSNGIANCDLFERNVMYFFGQGSLKFIDFNIAEFDVPAGFNKIMRNIGLIVAFCKLREAHECKEEYKGDCYFCHSEAGDVDRLIDQVSWESKDSKVLLERLLRAQYAQSLKPSEVYSSLRAKELLPQLTRT